jgi:superfamily II DNA or RNA helicase
MSTNQEENLPVRQQRCPNGERWNTKTKRCEKKKPKKYTFKRGLGQGQVILQRKEGVNDELQKDAVTIPEAISSLSQELTNIQPLVINPDSNKNDSGSKPNELTIIQPTKVHANNILDTINESTQPLQQHPIQIVKSKKRIKITAPQEQSDNTDYNKMSGQELRDLWASLMGLPLGQKTSGKFGKKSEIIEEIIRLKSERKNKKQEEDIEFGNEVSDPTVVIPEEPFQKELSPINEIPILEEEPVTENVINEPFQNESEPVINPIFDEEPLMEDIPEEPETEDDKFKNKELSEMEKKQYENAKTDTSYEFLYPELNDPNFNIKIAKRKEFNDTKYDGTIYDIKKQAELLCNSDFELMPHQLFVKNFLSFQTPYNSLLLFNALGSGKSCSAIGIAEEMRSYMKQVGLAKKILVIASPNVQENFKIQFFDESKLKEENGLWSLNTCVGNSLLKEINPTNLKGIPREKIISQINSIRNSFYSFLGYTELANYITKKTMVAEDSGFSEQEKRTYEIKKIRKVFNNTLIIIDEVHNLRITDDNKNKRTATLLMKVAKYANNLRFLLLSATPMYNSYKEIIWLLNLMNINDKRSTISEDEIFDKDGNFIKESVEPGNFKEGGRELLQRKLIGYVSYVRGENPYTFPFRIYPDLFSPEKLIRVENYPKVQMNKKPIENPIQYIPVYVNKIGEYQQKGYEFIMENMRKRSFNKSNSYGDETVMPSFENMEKFGYTLLEVPLEALNIVYPNNQFDNFLTRNAAQEIPYNQEEYTEIISNIIGKKGLSNIMNHYSVKSPQPMRYNFEYKPEILATHGKIFSKENISKYSNKIASVCDSVIKSKGIIIIYSQYIDGGCVPIALALEEIGFTRYGSDPSTKSLLKNPPEPIDSITMKPKSQTSGDFKQAKYVMITGDPNFSPNNANDIKYITKPENKNGELVKVIIISKAASEGLDFKNVRQVHIMEPWYNMNRIEQIIGRGVRNLSHCRLPFEDRNVEIYLHGTLPSNEEEPADLYVYRLAEKKALQIGKVTRVLKESAVDCLLNIGQTNFTIDKMMALAENSNIKLNLSSKKEPIEFKFGDKDFTDVCDYMECQKEFKCSPHADIREEEIIKDTYNEEYVKMNYPMILKRIRQLYKEQSFYKKSQLFDSINLIKKYPEEQIYYCLSELIDNKNEYIIDRYGRRGYLINRGDYYAFQPIEITDENASIFERDVPVDYKRDSMLLELQKDNFVTESIKPLDNVVLEKSSLETTLVSKSEGKSYEDILKELENTLDKSLNSKTIETGDIDWFKHVSQVIDILKDVHKIPINFIVNSIIYHYLDCLELKDRLTIINKLYSIEFQRETEKNIETIIRDYFEDKIISNKMNRAIILADMKTINMYILKEGKWVEARQVDREKFTQQISEKFLVERENINTFLGFMSVFKNQNIMFKTKDLSQTRNNIGAVCSQSGKADIIKRLNAVLEENIYFIKNTDAILKIGLCAILEIILRFFTQSNFKERGRIYFMDAERALLNKVSDL